MNKLGKIASIVIIVACLGSLYLAFSLGGKKKKLEADNTQLTGDLNSTRTQLGQAKVQLQKDAALLAQAKTDLDKANTDLASTKDALAKKTEEADSLQAKNTEMDQQLQATKTQLAKAEETINAVKEITEPPMSRISESSARN